MGKITTIQNKEFGEIRIGVDDDTPKDACVTLALNHWEDDEKWGGQPLSPKLAAYLGTLLIEYAAEAERVQAE